MASFLVNPGMQEKLWEKGLVIFISHLRTSFVNQIWKVKENPELLIGIYYLTVHILEVSCSFHENGKLAFLIWHECIPMHCFCIAWNGRENPLLCRGSVIATFLPSRISTAQVINLVCPRPHKSYSTVRCSPAFPFSFPT